MASNMVRILARVGLFPSIFGGVNQKETLNPAIVIPVYQRVQSLERLLSSIERAEFPQDVTLVFRTHKGVNPKVLELCKAYHWDYGDKQIIQNEKQLTLDDNIRACGDLTGEYGAVIILEDDLVVSPFFYEFTKGALAEYGEESSVAGIGLYSYTNNPVSGLRHFQTKYDHDAALCQKTVTWGQCFTKTQWSLFRDWCENNTVDLQLLPLYMQNYGLDNWELQHNAYLLASEKFVVHPTHALTTNSGLPGTHHQSTIDSGLFQVPLQFEAKNWMFPAFKELMKYDAYFEMKSDSFKSLLPKDHTLLGLDFDLDLAGLKPLEHLEHQMLLTSKKCKNAKWQYSADLKPKELNVIWNEAGNGLSLCQKSDVLHPELSELQKASNHFGETRDVGLRNWLVWKWLKYVDRKRNQ